MCELNNNALSWGKPRIAYESHKLSKCWNMMNNTFYLSQLKINGHYLEQNQSNKCIQKAPIDDLYVKNYA